RGEVPSELDLVSDSPQLCELHRGPVSDNDPLERPRELGYLPLVGLAREGTERDSEGRQAPEPVPSEPGLHDVAALDGLEHRPASQDDLVRPAEVAYREGQPKHRSDLRRGLVEPTGGGGSVARSGGAHPCGWPQVGAASVDRRAEQVITKVRHTVVADGRDSACAHQNPRLYRSADRAGVSD